MLINRNQRWKLDFCFFQTFSCLVFCRFCQWRMFVTHSRVYCPQKFFWVFLKIVYFLFVEWFFKLFIEFSELLPVRSLMTCDQKVCRWWWWSRVIIFLILCNDLSTDDFDDVQPGSYSRGRCDRGLNSPKKDCLQPQGLFWMKNITCRWLPSSFPIPKESVLTFACV